MFKAIAHLNVTLESLKDFQKATVDSVMRSFNDSKHSNRILVADEVGLGKTIVAKGIIAELLKNKLLSENTKFLKVTYICSNLTLAEENKKKLAVFQGDSHKKYVAEPTFGRLVELAVIDKRVKRKNTTLLEVNSLTPATSFNLTSGHGNKWERFIIYRMLIQYKVFVPHSKKLSELFRDGVMEWDWYENTFDNYYEINKTILSDYKAMLDMPLSPEQLEKIGVERGSLRTILEEYCLGLVELSKPIRLRTLTRSTLARCCAKNLQADLFILDEFQRFQSLLNTDQDNEESLIAREVFKKSGETKILLLSATPFKALSRLDEDEQNEAHLDELRKLLQFLSDNNIVFIESYEKEREKLLRQILSLRDKSINLSDFSSEHKEMVEQLLHSYICRTERSQVSAGFDAVFASSMFECKNTFSHDEIKSFLAMDQLGQALNKSYPGQYTSQLSEFYKAAPWALSFLSGYQFKKHLDTNRKDPHVRGALRRSSLGWLSRRNMQNYRLNLAISAPNAKLRSLMDMFFGVNGEELLWMPPSMPYYPLSGSFIEHDTFTKSLLFSSWALVPRALSGLISYEAERRNLFKESSRNYFDTKHNPSLRFEGKSSLDIWGLVYPSKMLTQMPLPITTQSAEEIIMARTTLFEEQFSSIEDTDEEITSTRYWFALAPMLLDVMNGHKKYVFAWLESELSKAKEDGGRYKHLEKLQEHLEENIDLRQFPAYLSRYLAELSIAGPGVCFARMNQTFWPKADTNFDLISDMTMAMMSMFNKPESDAILTKKYPKEKKSWQMVLNYCVEGNFQAMIDEYTHLLATSGFTLEETSVRFKEVLGFRTSSVACQFEEDKNKHLTKSSGDRLDSTLRCHYAVPLGTQKVGDDKATQRVSNVRDAFNSPFRPFVLNSTSIGQEGLDFHWYCSRVIHWNLPSNPIDIEQREGRINRYKALVVRRRLIEIYGSETFNTDADVWSDLFSRADDATRDNRMSDLVPYWYLPEGSAKIERIVPMMPMSKEVGRLKEALKILSLYRLAFGQPRQEELLSNLLEREMSDDEIKELTKKLVINLSPLVHQKKIKETK